MDQLPEHVLAYLGRFMDPKTRKNCMEVCRTMSAINHQYIHHCLILKNNMNMASHIPYITYIKPLCTDIIVSNAPAEEMDASTLASIYQVAQLANTTFSKVRIHLIISNTTTLLATAFLMAFQHWRIHELTIELVENEIFSPELILMIPNLSWTSPNAGLNLTLLNDQIGVLNNQEFMSLVQNKLKIKMTGSHDFTLNLSHVGHVKNTILNMSGVYNCTITSPQNIVHLLLSDILNTTANELCQSFQGIARDQMRMAEIWIHVETRSLVNIAFYDVMKVLTDVLPSTTKYFYFGGCDNPWMVSFLLRMRTMADVGILISEDQDEYLVSRIIQRLIPGIACKRPALDPVDLAGQTGYKSTMTLAQIYNLMSPGIQRVWYWLPFVDERTMAGNISIRQVGSGGI